MINHKYLLWVSTVVVGIFGIFLLASTAKISNTVPATNTVSFSGEGKVLAKPDIALVSFSIVTNSGTSKAAQDDNSKKSQKVTDFLKSQGVEEKDIKTSGYNVSPQYSYPRPEPIPFGVEKGYPDYYPGNPKITGYQITQSFEVKVRNLDEVSSILDGIVASEANQVYGLSFQVDEPNRLKEEAREMAIKEAKGKAKNLKKQLGISLGKIVSFSENGNSWPPLIYYKASALDSVGREKNALPSVPTGENEIVVNITLTYQIK